MKRTLIVLSLLGLLLGACGGGEEKKEANGDLKAKLLTAADLPDGFERTKAEETAPDSSNDEDSPCPELESIGKDYPGERDAEADFERQNDNGAAFVNQQITRFEDDETAEEGFEAFKSAFTKCSTMEETDEEGLTTKGTFETTTFADVGDDTHAALMKLTQTDAEGSTADLDGYLVAVRDGKHVMLLMSIGLGDEVSKAELEDIAEKAAERI